MMKCYNLRNAVLCLLFLLCFFNVKAQEMRAFGNYSMYFGNKNTGTIRSVEAGIDHGDFPSLAFQLSASYLNSDNKDKEHYDYDNYVLEKLSTKGSAINTSLGLKVYNVFLNQYEEKTFTYYIMPKLNLARIRATENFSSTDYFYPSHSFDEERSISSWQVYFGIEIGYEIFLSENNSNSIAICASYNRINLTKGLSKISHENFQYARHDSFGVGLSFYLGVKKPSKKK